MTAAIRLALPKRPSLGNALPLGLRRCASLLALALLAVPADAQPLAATERPLPGLPAAGVDPQVAEDSVPRVQIWRSGQASARVPQRIMRNRFAQVALAESEEAILVRLFFPAAQRGQRCQVLTGDGWSLVESAGGDDAHPLEGVNSLFVRPGGRVTFVLRRAPSTRRGSVWVVLNGVKTELRFVVLSAENQARLRQSSPRLAESLGLQ